VKVQKVLVAGAGQMGAGIAQVSAEAGLDVVMIDVAEEFIAKGMAGIEKQLARAVEKVGFRVLERASVMHVPRVLAVALARAIERHGAPESGSRYLEWLMRFEKLADWPTRHVTGYFTAVLAEKR